MTNSIAQVSVKRSGGYAAVGWLAVGILLVSSSVCAAAIQNPSFELYTGTTRPLPQSWSHSDHLSFNSHCTNLWATDGILSAGIFSLINKTFLPGDYQSFYQFIELTGMAAIDFDVRLAAYPSGTFEHFEAAFLVDGVPLWSQTVGGVYLNQRVRVDKMPGWHRLEFRLQALENGPYSLAYWTQWDNLRLLARTPIKAMIDLDPDTLNVDSVGSWITGYIELETGYDVALINGASVRLVDVPAYLGEQGWATPESNANNTADYDGDGVVERMVKFDRATVRALADLSTKTLKVTGELTDADQTLFAGTSTIRVINNGPTGN